MATLYENYITGDTSSGTMYGENWESQTFTPSVNHIVTSVKLMMHKDPGAGASPGNITVSIRATSSSLPTGLDLASGTTDGDTLTDDNAGEWREITFSAGALLLASTEYAIVVRVTGGDGSNYVNWRYDGTSPTYTDGQRAYSSNSGSGWTGVSDDDHMFEGWGDPSGSGEGGAIFPTETITRVTNLIHRYNRKGGVYTLEMALGEVTSDFGLPQWLSKPMASAPVKRGEKEVQQEVTRVRNEIADEIDKWQQRAAALAPAPEFIPESIARAQKAEEDRRREAAYNLEQERQKFLRLAAEAERERASAAYTLRQETLRFLRLAEEAKAKRRAPAPEPTLAPDVRRQIEAEKAQLRARATPTKPPVRPVSIEEEKARLARLRQRRTGGARGLRL